MSRFSPKIVTKPFPDGAGFESLIEGHAAVCFKDFIPQANIAPMVKAMYAAKDVWSEGMGGEQFALGDAWYHYAEEGVDFEEYGSQAKQSRANVEKYVPGLEKRVIDFLSPLARAGTLDVREGWAGPGIMLFPAGAYVSNNGGSIHFDTDAFTDEELADPNLTMFSFVCMLQKPERGGNLTIWNKHFDRRGERFQTYDPKTQGEVESCLVDYQPGQLWMLRGMNAHQIGSFSGATDRICLTFHIFKEGADWRMWF
jgi:hypothetical protein